MTKSEEPKFNMANEIEKMQKYLLLPITYIEFHKGYQYGKTYMDDNMNWIWINANLFINDELIGTIPYISSGHGFGYDTVNTVLEWDKIYAQFQQIIFGKIFQQEPLAVSAEPEESDPKEYGLLNVKDKDETLIKKAFCRFVDGEWEVYVSGLNYTTTTHRVNVVLTPPPPLNITGDQKSPE